MSDDTMAVSRQINEYEERLRMLHHLLVPLEQSYMAADRAADKEATEHRADQDSMGLHNSLRLTALLAEVDARRECVLAVERLIEDTREGLVNYVLNLRASAGAMPRWPGEDWHNISGGLKAGAQFKRQRASAEGVKPDVKAGLTGVAERYEGLAEQVDGYLDALATGDGPPDPKDATVKVHTRMQPHTGLHFPEADLVVSVNRNDLVGEVVKARGTADHIVVLLVED